MIENLLESERAELTQGAKKAAPVVLSTRIRLARNFEATPFPERASKAQRRDILSTCEDKVGAVRPMRNGTFFKVDQLSDLEKQVLIERHLVSRELCEGHSDSGVYINRDQSCSVMVNEEDHLRIQFLKSGFNLNSVWKQIDAFDTNLEDSVDLAFSHELGYLTACPTNLGTGMRASVMMHLPGLVITENMERVIRSVNQLGITVRGLFGEGSDATGHVFQISNQQTLGESEGDILKRLGNVLKTVIDQELNARFKFLEEHRARLFDKIGRAYGLLGNAHVLSSNEAMNQLSLIRLAVDFGMIGEDYRSEVDRLFIECQPGHVRFFQNSEIEADQRDAARAELLRREFGKLSPPDFDKEFTQE